MQNKNILGKQGEDLAVLYLTQHGFQIKHRNWRHGHKELDIVAFKNQTLHIVEVKTRTSGYYEELREALDRSKQRNIIAATEAYIELFDLNCDVSFDLIFILIDAPETERISYIANAFNAYE